MATIDSQSGGRGKPLNVEYNLVPFIDLLSCLIAFLLMTAVWSQITMIKTNEGTSGSSATKDDFTLALYVYSNRQELAIGEGSTLRIPKQGNDYNYNRLAQELLKVKTKYPAKKDILILAQDKVKYNQLIETMDTAIGTDIPNITLSGMLE